MVSLGNWTHVWRIAPNSRDILKDALPTELHGRGKLGFIEYVIVNSPMGNTSATAAKKLAGIAPRCCGSYVLKIKLNRVKKRLEAEENQSDKISGWLTSTEVAA